MNPDVERLRNLAVDWGGHSPEYEEPPPIAGAAANAISLLSKQVLESERRIKAVPRRDRAEAREAILQSTVSGYQLVRFLFGLVDPRPDGDDTPPATQVNMSRIMRRGGGYSDQEMAQAIQVPSVMAHAVDHALVSDEDGVLWTSFGGDARTLRMFGYMTGMRIGLAEQIEFGPFALFGPETIN
jgi:hypothetical protein